jgi:hypothetical protein
MTTEHIWAYDTDRRIPALSTFEGCVVVVGAVFGIICVAIIVTGCVLVLRWSGRSGDKRVFGPPIAGDELTEHEHELALQNTTIMNQQDILRRNGQLP